MGAKRQSDKKCRQGKDFGETSYKNVLLKVKGSLRGFYNCASVCSYKTRVVCLVRECSKQVLK